MKFSNMDMNEGYGIIIGTVGKGKQILFVSGKRISEHCAVTYNHLDGVYNITMIGTGMSVISSSKTDLKWFNTAKCAETVRELEETIKTEKMRQNIKKATNLYNNLIKRKKFKN